MNDENNPYQTSLGSKITQRLINGLSRVLLQENSVGRAVSITRADLITGKTSLRVSLYLPKIIEITYVQEKTNWLNTLPPETLRAQVLEYIRDGIADVLSQAKIQSEVVYVRYKDQESVAQFEVVLDDLAIVEKEFLPRVIEIEYA
ncbi:MAG: hypothetical protein K2Y22_14135 [Candidatus Obscuribacterales bacterium]|nr:hypothetical protein [Candidatus Obscuribacterales bacterium]